MATAILLHNQVYRYIYVFEINHPLASTCISMSIFLNIFMYTFTKNEWLSTKDNPSYMLHLRGQQNQADKEWWLRWSEY